ncbi:extensin family protein [Erythrobacter sp. HKB08]|uniref:extensin-like domain-containing protein n=1 Tax=Erythrobacter sp. HKB08 TaxID=2502843 RepID=UPI001F290828|nr:extensin family protein [Erythrobacter sp. HKB08]
MLLLAIGLLVAGRAWLAEHPEHNPWAPLDLDDPPGWATEGKLLALKGDPAECRAVLDRSDVTYRALEAAGEGQCARPDRTVMAALPLADPPATTCPVGIGLHLWMRDVVQPAAMRHLGSEIAQVDHLGAYSCRRMYGSPDAPWSEHATGNAIDIAGFETEDGQRISVLADWADEGAKARFLRDVRDGSCQMFATVLSPDYNEAHRDHFHFDQSERYRSVCR